jgi:ABC-type uncharacterized transport system auxiliary subunit
MRQVRSLLLLLCALALGGCLGSLLPATGARAQYAFPDPADMTVERALPGAVLVEMPSAVAPRDGSDILVLRADGEFQWLPGARWAAAVPSLMQGLLARQIEAAKAAPAAVRLAQAHAVPFRLAVEIHGFELREEGDAFAAHGSISLRLVCTRDARLLASSEPITVEARPVPTATATATLAMRQTAALLARQATLWLSRADISGCMSQPDAS